MTTKTKGRNRLHGGATPKIFDTRNHTGEEPLTAWFSLVKPSRNRQPKRSWQKGGRHGG